MTRKRKKDLQATIEAELVEMFDSNATPDEGRMKLVTLGIKYLAVKNKLEENQYGDFFNDGDTGGVPEKSARQEPAAGRRANGAGAGTEPGGAGEA
jgi:hypothetical protein